MSRVRAAGKERMSGQTRVDQHPVWKKKMMQRYTHTDTHKLAASKHQQVQPCFLEQHHETAVSPSRAWLSHSLGLSNTHPCPHTLICIRQHSHTKPHTQFFCWSLDFPNAYTQEIQLLDCAMTQKLPLQFTVLKWQKYKTRMTCKNKQTPKQNSATDSISIF